MHIISMKMLREFWLRHPSAEAPLRHWYFVIKQSNFANERDESDIDHIVPSKQLRAILAGSEHIDNAIAEQLAAFFHTSPSVFIPH